MAKKPVVKPRAKADQPAKPTEWQKAKQDFTNTIRQSKINQGFANMHLNNKEVWPAEIRADPGSRIKKRPAPVGKGGR